MPSTFVPFRMTSAFISIARSAAAVSVVKYGIARAGREDDDAAFLEVANRPAADERLGDRAHLDGGDDARQDAVLLERVLHGQAVDDRGEHAHVVAGGAIHALRAGGHAAEDVAAADDDADFDAEAPGFLRCLRRCGR